MWYTFAYGIRRSYGVLMQTFYTAVGSALAADGATKLLAGVYSTDVIYNLGQTRFGAPTSVQILITVICVIALVIIVCNWRELVRGIELPAGLMVGGSLGNLASLAFGPPGVIDFIYVGNIAFNVADVFLWIGSPWLVYVVARAAVREAA